jgi:hypothetical protein
LALPLVLLAFGCAGGGGGGSSAPNGPAAVSLLGKDMSGTYIFRSITCLDNIGNFVSVTQPSSTLNDTLKIKGNSFTEDSSDGTCSATSAGSMQFVDSVNLAITDQKVTSATGGACTLQVSISGPITPNPYTYNFVLNQIKPNISGAYAFNEPAKKLYIYSKFSDGNAQDKCLLTYDKQ